MSEFGLYHACQPDRRIGQRGDALTEQFALMPSGKHMVGRDLGRQEPSPSLKHKAIAMAA